MMKVPSRWRLGLGLALMTPAVLTFTVGPSHADSSFTATAEAQTLHVTITNDKGSIPTLPQLDAGIGSAQVRFTSFGGGVARAASPDAGSAAGLPALLGAVAPGLVPFPLPISIPAIPVPGDITVQSGEEPASVGTGPYSLGASVTSTESSARASLGGALDDDNGALRALSTAKITVGDDGSVTSRATSSFDGVKVNGLLAIGRVQSTAVVTREADGTIRRESDLNIAAIDLAGLSVVYRDGQFVTPVGKVPVPLGDVIKLVSELTGGALELEVVSAKNTKNGIVAGTLRLIQTAPEPPQCVAIPLPTPVLSGVTYCGKTTVVYEFGKAVASADLTPIPETPLPPVDGSGGGTTDPDPGTGPVSGPLPAGELPLDVPLLPTGQLPQLTDPVAEQRALLALNARFVDMSNLYLALMGFAGLLLLSSTCIRMLGVRNKWTS